MPKKPNTHARTEAALRATRSGRELQPSAEPAIGDVLWIMGTPMKLVAIVSAGGRGAERFRVYRFKDQRYPERDQTVDIPR